MIHKDASKTSHQVELIETKNTGKRSSLEMTDVAQSKYPSAQLGRGRRVSALGICRLIVERLSAYVHFPFSNDSILERVLPRRRIRKILHSRPFLC